MPSLNGPAPPTPNSRCTLVSFSQKSHSTPAPSFDAAVTTSGSCELSEPQCATTCSPPDDETSASDGLLPAAFHDHVLRAQICGSTSIDACCPARFSTVTRMTMSSGVCFAYSI